MKKLLIFALLAAPCFGAIALDTASTSVDTTAGTSLNWNHTVSGTDRFLLVTYHGKNSAGDISNVAKGVTYNGVALTFIRNDSAIIGFFGVNNSIWYLVAPPTGTHPIVITLTSELSLNSAHADGEAVSFTGVHQTTPINVHGGTSGTAASMGVSLTTTAPNAWILGSMTLGSAGTVPTSNGTLDSALYVKTFIGATAHKATTTAGANTLNWTSGDGPHEYWVSAVAIAPAPAVTTGTGAGRCVGCKDSVPAGAPLGFETLSSGPKMTYTLDGLTNGTYQMILSWWDPAYSTPGSRVMTLLVNDVLAATALDPAAMGGGFLSKTVARRAFLVPVIDGRIVLVLSSNKAGVDAILSAIEVAPAPILFLPRDETSAP